MGKLDGIHWLKIGNSVGYLVSSSGTREIVWNCGSWIDDGWMTESSMIELNHGCPTPRRVWKRLVMDVGNGLDRSRNDGGRADLEWRLSRVPISYNSVAFYRVATNDFAGYIFGIFFFSWRERSMVTLIKNFYYIRRLVFYQLANVNLIVYFSETDF